MPDTDVKPELKDIGLCVSSIANRMTSVGVVGLAMVILCLMLFGFWTVFRESLNQSRTEVKDFMAKLEAERDRNDKRYETVRAINDQRHQDVIRSMSELAASVNSLNRTISGEQRLLDARTSTNKVPPK